MRSAVFFAVAALAACSGEPSEEERRAAVAEVEANQTPPPVEIVPDPIRYPEIEKYDLFGGGCSFAAKGGGLAAVAIAMEDTGHFLLGGDLVTLAADKGSDELPYLAWRKYDGKAYSMMIDLNQDAGQQSGEETSDYPAMLTIRNARGQVVYRENGIAQCGV